MGTADCWWGAQAVKVGDKITLSGLYEKIPNPKYRWWKFWVPKEINGPNLKILEVIAFYIPED